MCHIITKETPIKEGISILSVHGISTQMRGWELIIGLLLNGCDYLEVHGFGSNAYFTQVTKEEGEEDVRGTLQNT